MLVLSCPSLEGIITYQARYMSLLAVQEQPEETSKDQQVPAYRRYEWRKRRKKFSWSIK